MDNTAQEKPLSDDVNNRSGHKIATAICYSINLSHGPCTFPKSSANLFKITLGAKFNNPTTNASLTHSL